MNEYRAHGIDIRSELPCPELLPGGNPPDLTIRIGPLPARLADVRDEGVCHQAGPHDLLLHIDGIARYRIAAGSEIVVEPARQADEDSVRHFLLGAALAVALCQRGLLVLRASAVAVDGRAIVFAGRAGTGTSALAAALWKRGHPVFSDDLCSMSVDEARAAVVHFGAPRLHLWAETLTALGLARDGLRRVRPPLEKFALPVASDGPTEALALGRIFVFVDEPGAFACEIGAGAEKLLPLRGAGYCGRFMKGMGRGAQHFRHCVALAHQAEVFRVSGARRLGSIDALADELERRLLA